MGSTAAVAAQLQEFLQQIAHKAASSRNDGAATAGNCKQHSTRQAILQAMQAADNSIEVLLQVPWFAELATVGCKLASITAEGHVILIADSPTNSNSNNSAATATQHQQQQQGNSTGSSTRQGKVPEIPADTQLSILAATTLAKLALQRNTAGDSTTTRTTSSTIDPSAAAAAVGADQVLLQQLMPQLLLCQAAIDPGSFSSHWTSIMVAAASQLHASGCGSADRLATLCLLRLQARLGCNSSSTSSSSSVSSSSVAMGVGVKGSLQLGDAACLALLAALLGTQQQQQQATLDPGMLQQLVSCALTGLSSAGGDLQSELQSVLLQPLIAAAAAAQLPPPAYAAACQQLVAAACAGAAPDSSSRSSAWAAGAASGSSSSSSNSSKVAAGLSLACRLQEHVRVACQQQGSAAAAARLHELLLLGLCSQDGQARGRALHLLQAAVRQGWGPQVSGLAEPQWQAFMAVFRAQEERVLHLIEPVWSDSFHLLWQNATAGRSNSSSSEAADMSGLVRWCSVLLVRAAFHSNVSARRLGLASLFQLPSSTLQHLIAHSGWQQLQALLLQLLAAFENEKLVSEVAAGSAMTRQAQAVAALQQQLTGFLVECLTALSQQQQQQQQQHQQVGDKQGDLVASLLTAYLDRVVEVSERAPSAAVLLQAAADATSQVASAAAVAAGLSNSTAITNSSSRGSSMKPISTLCELGPQELLAHFSAVLAHVSYLHPAYMRPRIHRAVLQLVPLCCSAPSCGAAVALSVLAASTNLQQNAAAAAAAGDDVAECFMTWLDAALSSPAESAETAAAAAADGSLSQLQLWLQPLQEKSSSAAALPQLKLLHCLGLVSARLCDSNQQAIAAVLQAGAAAVAGSSAEVSAGVEGTVAPAGDAAAAAATALACLACGVAVSLQTCTAAAASDASRHDTPSATAVAAGLQQLLPALLRHHRTVHAAVGVYKPTWVNWLMQLLQNVLHTSPQSAAEAAAADARHRQQLQAAVLGELTIWQQQLAGDCAAAAAAAALDQQLLLLSTSHMACYSLQCSTDQQRNHVTDSLTAAEVDSCLQSLCQLEPGSSFSGEWQAQAASSSSSSVSRSEMTDCLLELRLLLVAQLVAAAGAVGVVPGSTQQLVFHRCLQDLEWASSDATLQPLLSVLLVVAPFKALAMQKQQQQDTGSTAAAGPHHCWTADEAASGLQQLLQQLQPLVRSSKRLSAGTAQQLVQLFFHPAMFCHRELEAYITSQLIPFGLAQGGVRLSVSLMSHLCSSVLGPDPQLLARHLPQVAHMCAFSLFSESLTQQAALQQQKCDASVLLPARVVLCGFLLQLARSQTKQGFIRSLLLKLLDIAQAAAAGPYAWLASREAGQGSAANAIKVAVWQALCVLAPWVDNELAPEVLQRGWQCLLNCHQHGNIRPQVQLFLLPLLQHRPDAVATYLLRALNTYETSSYQVTVSVIILVLFLLLESGPGASPHFMTLLRALLPWGMHHRHAVRVPVQALLHVVFSRHMESIQQQLGQQDGALLQQVQRFLDENDETSKLRERQALVDLQRFSLAQETSLQGVFGVHEHELEQLCDGEGDSKGLIWALHVRERLPLDILKALPGALKAVSKRDGGSSSSSQRRRGAAAEDAAGEAEEEEAQQGAADDSSAAVYQFRPQVEYALFDESCVDRVEALVAGRAATAGLVVCASLLDNVPNMAGLCRTCESMSVEALVLSNRSVAATEAFKRQSVTSERWLRLLEVGAADVARLLQERRQAGYTIIGVEQATNSVALQSYCFPKLCVLLLGNEQNGIPVSLLPLLDVCVEIPMLGVTRSLNAHVSGAMVVWQYTQQHLPQPGC